MNGPAGKIKTDNSDRALEAKLGMRRAVRAELERAGGCRVLETMAGRGTMSEAWRGAKLHHANDTYLELAGEWRGRFVGDAALLLRGLDLRAYNVFDVDTYGAPWPYLAILEDRRRWRAGELGAIVCTDGSPLKLRWGGQLFGALARYVGEMRNPPTTATCEPLIRSAIAGWLKRSRVKLRKLWWAGEGEADRVFYYAALFEG